MEYENSEMNQRDPHFPNIALGVPEDQFVLRLWQALTASGHILTLDHVRASLILVDSSFAPKPPEPVST